MKGVLQWVKGHYKPLASALLFAALALFLLLGADAPGRNRDCGGV